MSEEDRKKRKKETDKRYYQKNKEKVLKRQKEYAKRKYKEDEEFRNKIREKNKRNSINKQMLIKQLQQRIDKAIEYVEDHRIKNPYHYEYNCFMGNARASDLLEILKGGNNE